MRGIARWGAAALLVLLMCASATAPVEAQTRADTAAVLLHTAEQLRLQGETAAARVILEYLERQYAGTASAAAAQRMRVGLRGVQQERPGRIELLVGGTTYGAWLGVAVPLMVDSDSPEAYGVGFLAGAPLGFLAARAYAQRRQPTEGQARAITFGGTWGTYQGFAWAEALDLAEKSYVFYCEPETPDVCYEDSERDGPKFIAAGVAGGLLGIATGAYLARKPITAGTAAAVSTSGLWASWFGFAAGILAGQEDDALLTTMLLAGNAGLIGSGIAAPRWNVTEGRVRLISLGGLIGGLAGVGALLVIQPDDEKVAISIPLVTSAAGLALGLSTTRERDARRGDGGAGGEGALLRMDGRRWALDAPLPMLRLQRGATARLEPVAYMPLVRARF
jgi:hypothetical protein